MPWHEKAGGRKFILATLAIVCGFVLALLGRLTGDFSAVLIASTAFFSLGNTATTVASLKYPQDPQQERAA